MKQFSNRNIFGFTFQGVARKFQNVAREFPEKNRGHLPGILAYMVDIGMLAKITRGYYNIIPFNADPNTQVPDRHQVAKYIMQNKEY